MQKNLAKTGPDDDPLEREQRPLDRRLISRMYHYAQRYAATRNTLLLLVVLRAIQLPTLSWGIARILSGPVAAGDIRATAWGALGLFAWLALTEYTFTWRMRLALRLGEAVASDLRSEIYHHILTMPMEFFNKTRLGSLLSRITSDVDVVRIGIQDVVFVSTVQAGSMVIAAVLMFYYDWFLFLVVLFLVPLLWFLIKHFRAKLYQAYRDVQETYSRLTSSLAETVNGVRVIQGFVRQEHNALRFSELLDKHSDNNMRAARDAAVLLPLLELNGQVFLAIVLVLGGYQAFHGSTTLEALIQFVFLSQLFFGPVSVLGNQYNQALTAMAGAERIFTLLDTKPAWSDEPEARELGEVRGEVEFRDVSFAYQPGQLVLHGISFKVDPGQTVALVGETGSGKTTITKLLAKLHLPTQGEVSFDGKSVTAIQSRSLHHHLGTVPQDNFLFSGTVAENIRFAKPEATREQVVDVVRQLGVLDLIEKLPQGFDTEVGEKGASLAHGERQIVCFARALLSNPRILILDEATSSIDAVTEARLQRALSTLLRGRTSFIVAHRLSTTKNADLILLLDHGRIVERGTHAGLLAENGAYAKLYRQFVRSAV